MSTFDLKNLNHDSYIKSWKQRCTNKKREILLLRTKACNEAKKLADVLYTRYSATHVYLFGSLREKKFNERSDIDLAVEGLAGTSFFEATGELLSKSSFPVNLIPLEDCQEKFRQKIKNTGELL